MDLDNGCSRSLDPLLYYPAFVIDGGKGTLSNNILGARPDHPFWKLIVKSLEPWSWYYVFPYFTVHYASGQWFETAIWDKYWSRIPADAPEEDIIYRVMADMGEGADRWVFFTQGRGGSWDTWDNQLFSYVGNVMVPWILGHLVWTLVASGGVVGLVVWRNRRRRRKGYTVMGGEMA